MTTPLQKEGSSSPVVVACKNTVDAIAVALLEGGMDAGEGLAGEGLAMGLAVVATLTE